MIGLVLTSIILPSSGAVPHRLSASAVIGIQNLHQGFDRQCAPLTSSMTDWWANSRYWYVGIYIGGKNRGSCSPQNLDASWVSTVNGQGWSFLPTYVGLQSQCVFQSGLATFPNDTSTAYSDGQGAADSAINDGSNLGFSDSIVYYDLEGFDTTNSACLAAAKSFVDGWVKELQTKGWEAGLYGSACSSAMDAMFNINQTPNDGWLAAYDGNNTPWGVSCVPNSDWVQDHRIHQYHKDSSCETHGSTCMTVDRNCAIGETAKAWSFSVEPADSNEGSGPTEDAGPCGS